jgi:putative acetyltransferase
MPDEIHIKSTTPSDVDLICALYPSIFPEEDLLQLVKSLLQLDSGILSLVACTHSGMVAHIALTLCGMKKNENSAALLGPLGVLPDYQQCGIGSTLVRRAFQQLETTAVRQVFVLGDPVYYRRFGFTEENSILPPYPLPEQWRNAWQSMTLSEQDPLPGAQLWLPEPWLRQELWTP